MKKLILVRHAKSSWKFNVIDHERPLTDRGVNDSKLIAISLKRSQITPNLVLVSDATRTKQTAALVLSSLNINQDHIVFNHDLYDFEGQLLTKVIKQCDSKINTLMVFCHNHALTHFVNTYGSLKIDHVPTCGVVTINFNIERWSDINIGHTQSTLFPRDLK